MQKASPIFVLRIRKPEADLVGTNVLKYLKWGEDQKFNMKTPRKDDMWLCLSEIDAPPSLCHF
jgi:hypothetical protein